MDSLDVLAKLEDIGTRASGDILSLSVSVLLCVGKISLSFVSESLLIFVVLDLVCIFCRGIKIIVCNAGGYQSQCVVFLERNSFQSVGEIVCARVEPGASFINLFVLVMMSFPVNELHLDC